jgi:AbrB family looped-hinge helix DNA binding protein
MAPEVTTMAALEKRREATTVATTPATEPESHEVREPDARVDEEGRIVLSREMRRNLGLEPGDTFEVVLGGEMIALRPCLNEDDEDPALFWGPNWREDLDEAFAGEAAGRTSHHYTEEEFLALLESRVHADIWRGGPIFEGLGAADAGEAEAVPCGDA